MYATKHQIAVTSKQNEFLKAIDRIIINVANATLPHQVQGNLLTFQHWLCNASVGSKQVIQGVELAENKVVRILFLKEDRYDIELIARNLYDETVKKFGPQKTDFMISKQEIGDVKFSHNAEMSHSQQLLSMTGNPQGPSEQSVPSRKQDKKVKLYYGTYLDVAEGEPSQTSEITQELHITLNNLANR